MPVSTRDRRQEGDDDGPLRLSATTSVQVMATAAASTGNCVGWTSAMEMANGVNIYTLPVLLRR